MTPACACHGVEMRWNRDPRYKAGGFWKCRETGNAQRRRRYDTEPVYRMASHVRARHSERKHRGIARRAERPDVRPEIAAALRTVKRQRS